VRGDVELPPNSVKARARGERARRIDRRDYGRPGMIGTMAHRLRSLVWRDVIRFLDSYASLLVLLIANFFLLELVDDVRWGALGSTLLSSAALVVAISDPESGHHIQRRHLATIIVAVVLAPLALFVTSGFIVGLTYLLPVALLVTATLPVTLSRVIQHRRVTHETVLGALCIYVLLGLLFAFAYIAVDELRDAPFFAQGGERTQPEYVYFSFVTLTTLGFGDLSPAVGLPQALTVAEAVIGQVFLVTLVARLVTLWVRQSEERSER
jgi:voltage-gated potassium channel